MLRSSQRRSTEQEQGKLRATAEQEEIDGVHPENVYEIVPMEDTDELHRRIPQDQSVDSTSKVLGSIMVSASLSINRLYFQGTKERLIYV